MSAKNKHRSANDYLQYLKGKISSQERHAFEKGLEADPFEQEAMEGLESLETGQTEQDILYLHARLRKRLSRRRRVAFYSVAATVASLIIVGTVFLKIHDFNPSSDEKQVYLEEVFDSGTPSEAQAIPPAQKEAQAEEPISPARVRTQEIPQAATLKEPDVTETNNFAMVAEDKAEAEEEQITHLEAEPRARDKEDRVTQSARNPRMHKKSMAPAAAQSPQEISMLSGKVSGIVISAEDQGPIPGAIVENRELNSGVFTDLDGRFDIAVQEDSPTTLVASFIGMETQEYHVSDGEQVELLLQPDTTTLDEVMVVGYVAQEEAFPTGSAFDIYEAEKEKGSNYTVPEPVIGTKNYKKYLEQNIEFPQIDTDLQRAIVVLRFKVTRNGKIKEIVALKSPGEAFTSEATRLLKEGPDWNPASNDNGTKDESVRMRIVFKR